MSKTKKINKVKTKKFDFERLIMDKVKSDKIVMKPKWYFVIGSLLSFVGFASLIAFAIFLVNVIFFILRSHGPMGSWKLQTMLNNFPVWVPIAAITGIITGIFILKKYDFSYKKNFPLLIISLVMSIIIAAWMIDKFGLNENWSKRGPMKGFYQKLELNENFYLRNQRLMDVDERRRNHPRW